jgi:dephospho-CoA kinase
MSRYTRRPAPVRARRRPGPWKHGAIPVLGLVGGIGAGKSYVARELAGQGAVVLDADAIGHALLDQRPARDLVLERFDSRILAPPAAGESRQLIDRKALAAIVFEDRHARRDLEAILHPRMRRTVEKAIDRNERRRQAKAIVLDAPVLFEAGWNDLCDRVLFVDSSREERLARLAEQRGWSESDLSARELTQMDLEKKREMADAVVVNNGSVDQLHQAMAGLLVNLFPRPHFSRGSRLKRDDAALPDANS